MSVLQREFFTRDALTVAPELVGKTLVRTLPDGTELRAVIVETEAYRGEEDTACHAHKGRTRRTETLYKRGGTVYVYLCYGMHWMLNIVTGEAERPQAVLLRATSGENGPGKLTRALGITGDLNGADICACPSLRIEDEGIAPAVEALPRVGIEYASEEDRQRLWRFRSMF